MAWLAIFAMLLLALAPTVSQWRGAHAPHDGHAAHVAASAPAGHAAASDHAGHVAHAALAQDASGDDCAGDCWRKCGYCDFLAHAPVLAAVALTIAVSPLPPAIPAPRHRRAPRHAERFSPAQPRGPPVLA